MAHAGTPTDLAKQPATSTTNGLWQGLAAAIVLLALVAGMVAVATNLAAAGKTTAVPAADRSYDQIENQRGAANFSGLVEDRSYDQIENLRGGTVADGLANDRSYDKIQSERGQVDPRQDRRAPRRDDRPVGVSPPINEGRSPPGPRFLYGRDHADHCPVPSSRHGSHPLPGRHHVPGLGASCDGGLRDRDVRRLGRATRRRWRATATAIERDLVGGRRGRRPRRRSTASRSGPRRGRPVADRPVRPPGHELGRQRHRLRPGRLRLGRRCRSQMPSWDDLVIYEMHVGTFAPSGDRRGHVRRRAAAAATTSTTSASQPSRSCRRSNSPATSRGATTRPTCSPSSRRTAGRTRSRRSSATPTPAGIAVIVDVVYNHLGPVGPRPVAVRRLGRGRRRRDLLLQRRAGGDAVGLDPARLRSRRGPHLPARQRDDLARGVPLRRPPLRFDRATSGRLDGEPAQPGVGPAARRLVVPGLDQRRDPDPPAVEDHDRRGPRGRSSRSPPRRTRAAPASAPSGTRGSSAGCGPSSWSSTTTPTATSDAIVAGIVGKGRGEPLHRVIYTESHDEVANGLVRVPEAISPGDADSWFAKKRAMLGSALVLTSPGIPMLFQGQELLEDGSFDDTVPLDWDKTVSNRGVVDLHRDLIRLRRDSDGVTRGLRGSNVAILRADQRGQGAGDAPLDGRRSARRHGRGRELREPQHHRHAARVPGTGPLERAIQLGRDALCDRVRQPRRIRPGRGRSAAGRPRAERRRSRSGRTAW